MKKFMLFATILFATITSCSAQQAASPRITAEGKDVKVSYGQPSKKGRVIFGELVPYNKVWRTGANEATEITFAKDMTFGGKPVKAGTYSLFTIPSESEWTIILNSELKQWGSYEYEKIKGKDALQVKVPAKKVAMSEKLTMNFDDSNNLNIMWDEVGVSVPVK
ncbi:MAG: DUF2911 domain-containing protein [Flavitalea sp.]